MSDPIQIDANLPGDRFRAQLNSALALITGLFGSPTPPVSPRARQWWVDTSVTPAILRIRSGANSAWIQVGEADSPNLGLNNAATISNTLNQLFASGVTPSIEDKFTVEGRINLKSYGASGLGLRVTTGTVGAGSFSLAVANASGWSIGQGIMIDHAGIMHTLQTPAAPTSITAIGGGTGTTTWGYKIVALTAKRGYTAAGPELSIPNQPLTLSKFSQYNLIRWAAVSGAWGYAIYRTSGGTAALIGVTTGLSLADFGQGAPWSIRNDWPVDKVTPPTTVAADWLVTRINAIVGAIFTLQDAAVTGVTNADISHDDTAAFAAAFAAAAAASSNFTVGTQVYMPPGSYVYLGSGIDVSGINLAGPERGSSDVWIGYGNYLFKPSGPLQYCLIAHCRFFGGVGVLHHTRTLEDVIPAYQHVHNVAVLDFTGLAFGSESSDFPFWIYEQINFRALDYNGTIGIMLSGTGGSRVQDCDFGRVQIAVKELNAGLNDQIASNFFGRGEPWQGQQRIGVWAVPGANSSVEPGSGLIVRDNKWGNENIEAGDLRILYADEGPGTDHSLKLPALAMLRDGVTDAVTTGWAANTGKLVNDRIKPTVNNASGYFFAATVAGTTGASAPTFPQTIGTTVADGTVTWKNIGLGSLDAASAAFDPALDVGKAITIEGAGADGRVLMTTIAAVVSATAIGLADAVATEVALSGGLGAIARYATVSAGFIEGHIITGGAVFGAGTKASVPIVYSTTPNVRNLVFGNMKLATIQPTYALEVLSAPTSAIQFDSANLFGPITSNSGVSRSPYEFNLSNVPDLIRATDPAGMYSVRASSLPAFPGAGDEGAVNVTLAADINSFSLSTGITIVTPNLIDALGETDAAEFNIPNANPDATWKAISAGLVLNRPGYVEFDVKRSTTNPMKQLQVAIRFAGGAFLFQRNVEVQTDWKRYRFVWIPFTNLVGGVASQIILEFNAVDATSLGNVQIGRVTFYQAAEPTNTRSRRFRKNVYVDGSLTGNLSVVVYSASMTSDLSTGTVQKITITNGTAFTINNPTGLPMRGGTEWWLELKNTFGVPGAVTLGSAFLPTGAGAISAPALNKTRLFKWLWDGTNHILLADSGDR